jgi:hypothetical protein
LAGGVASAQSTYGTPSVAEAEGFRLSDTGRLHLYVNVDLRYDSNPAIQPAGLEVGDMALRLRGGLRLLQPSERLEIVLGIAADWSQYLGLVKTSTRSLSALQGEANLEVTANKAGAVSVYLTDALGRVESPTEISISERLKSTRNTARIGLDYRPGGRALEFGASYGFDINWYDANQQVVVNSNALTTYSHLIHAQALWHFFPKTAATFEADEQIARYPFAATAPTSGLVAVPNAATGATTEQVSPNVPEVDTNPFKARLGLIGLLTEKLTVRLNAGYANTFISGPLAATASNEQTAIGMAQLTWKPTEVITVSGGFIRDVAPVSLYGWFDYDRVFLEYQHFVLARLIFSLRGSYEYDNFGKSPIASLVARHDNVLRGEARVSYQALRWLTSSIFYLPEARLTDYKTVGGIGGSYVRHVVGIDATFGY